MLVTGSSEEYGAPGPADLPLTETAAARSPQSVRRLKRWLREAVALQAGRSSMGFARSSRGRSTIPGRASGRSAVHASRIAALATRDKTQYRPAMSMSRRYGDVRDVVRAYAGSDRGSPGGRRPASVDGLQHASRPSRPAWAPGSRAWRDGRRSAGSSWTTWSGRTTLKIRETHRCSGRDPGWRPADRLEATLADVLAAARQSGPPELYTDLDLRPPMVRIVNAESF